MKRCLVLAASLMACGRAPERAAEPAGVALERTAVARGIVADPARANPTGLYASASDTVCVVPSGGGSRIGASVDYGEGQRCFATGIASGRELLDVRFGRSCRLTARVDGDRIEFPATLPAECERLCTGRASLAALSADRISDSAAEAASAVTGAGTRLCLGRAD